MVLLKMKTQSFFVAIVIISVHSAMCATVPPNVTDESSNPTTRNPTTVQMTNATGETTLNTTTTKNSSETSNTPASSGTTHTASASTGTLTTFTTKTLQKTSPTRLTTKLTTKKVTTSKKTKPPVGKPKRNGKNGRKNGRNGRKNGRKKKQPKKKTTVKVKTTKKPAPPKKKKAPVVDDSFLSFFEYDVTTAETLVAPPDFDPNKKGHKVMPKVDTKNSRAHDNTLCNITYQPHETIKTKYMMRYAEGVWEVLDCPPNLSTGLIWRQDLCSCGEELVPQDPDDWCGQMGFNEHTENRHKYFRRHHGIDAAMDCAANLVWSQKNCLCIFDPTVKERPIEHKVTFVCKTILNMKFEGNLKNAAGGYHVQPVKLRRRGKLPRIRYMKTAGSTEKAAMVVSQPLEFQAFKGNDFQTQVTYSINFKISPHHLRRTNFMTLFTDECKDFQGGQNRERKPGISLQFQPNTRTFRLQFRTETTSIDEMVRGAKPDEYGWYKTVLYLEDFTLNLENGGKKLFTQNAVEGKVPQNRCPLFIAGRGQGYDRSQDFYGYMDNIFLVKDCRFHEANIKIL